ncbi:MAG: hypothetical protein ACT4SY_00875 [Hyphomicrobiales bacterium]
MRILTVGLTGLLLMGGMAQAQLTADNFRDAHVGIMSAGSRAANVAGLRHVPSVTVIDLQFRLVPRMRDDAPEPAELEISAQKNAVGVRRLRAALGANPAIRAALSDAGVPLGRIVAVRIFSNGALLVYIL